MSKASKAAAKAAKHARRLEAMQRIGEIRAVAYGVRPNDPGYVHVTVWLSEGVRVEWWPGGGKWGLGRASTKSGTFDEFKAWVVANRRHDDPEDDFDLIERADQ